MTLIHTLLDYLRGSRKKSAVVAKERLKLIIAHERRARSGAPEYLPRLKEELLHVIAKYVAIDHESIQVNLEKHGDYDVLELNITLSDGNGVAIAMGTGAQA
jgi:cell division topological specificity factor